jgi:hypothetical protein
MSSSCNSCTSGSNSASSRSNSSGSYRAVVNGYLDRVRRQMASPVVATEAEGGPASPPSPAAAPVAKLESAAPPAAEGVAGMLSAAPGASANSRAPREGSRGAVGAPPSEGSEATPPAAAASGAALWCCRVRRWPLLPSAVVGRPWGPRLRDGAPAAAAGGGCW